MSAVEEFCIYLKNRIRDLSRELDREFADWNRMLETAIRNGGSDPEAQQKTMEYHRRRDMLRWARAEFQRMLDDMEAPGAQV